MKGGAVRQDLGFELKVLAFRQHRDAVIAKRAADEDRVAGAGSVSRDVDAFRHDADAGRRDENAVAFAFLDHLRVTRDDGRARLAGGSRHAGDDAVEIGQREPLLQHEGCGEIERARAGHGHVVDRAMDRERADVSAGKEQGRDDMRVGCHDETPCANVEGGLIVALGEVGVAEMAMEEIADEFGGGPPPAAMDHFDRAAQVSVSLREAGLDDRHAASDGEAWRNRP